MVSHCTQGSSPGEVDFSSESTAEGFPSCEETCQRSTLLHSETARAPEKRLCAGEVLKCGLRKREESLQPVDQ